MACAIVSAPTHPTQSNHTPHHPRPLSRVGLPVSWKPPDARQDNPQKALELFQKVVSLEAEKGPEIKWRFKALEHLVRIYFQLRDFDQMLQVGACAVLWIAVLCGACCSADQTQLLSVLLLWYLLHWGEGEGHEEVFPP